MKTLRLNTGANIPMVGFGTWEIVPNNRAKAAVSDALDAGYRLLDTAKVYGNEKGVGDAIRQTSVARKDIFLTTKLWQGEQGYTKALKAFETSLRLLGTDYVDLYLIHWPGGNGDRHESWRAFTEIQETGRAKAIGVSNFTVDHLRQLKKRSSVIPAVNQVEFHPYLYKAQTELLAYCAQEGIVVEAYSPLAHGLLRSGRFKSEPVFLEIGERYGKSSAQVVLRWCVQHGTVPLPKTTNREHMHDNIDIFDFELTPAEMTAINNLSDGTRVCWDPNRIA